MPDTVLGAGDNNSEQDRWWPFFYEPYILVEERMRKKYIYIYNISGGDKYYKEK